MQAAIEDRVFSFPVSPYEQDESDEDRTDDESYILEQQVILCWRYCALHTNTVSMLLFFLDINRNIFTLVHWS